MNTAEIFKAKYKYAKVLGVALLVAVALVVFFASLFLTRGMPVSAVGLSLFATLQILIAAGTFIAGRGVSSDSSLALAVMVPGTALLGWFVVRSSEAVAALGAVASGIQSVTRRPSRRAEANYSGMVLIIIFCGAYFATQAVCAPLVRRRRSVTGGWSGEWP